MSKASDYFKFFETAGATAVAADILVGEIGYIEGGRVVGQGIAPVGSLTAFYRTQDATIDPNVVAAWKTAYGKNGLVIGAYYSGPVPATGGILGLEPRSELHTPTGDIFNITAR